MGSLVDELHRRNRSRHAARKRGSCAGRSRGCLSVWPGRGAVVASATGADGITRTADRLGLAWGGLRVQGLDVTGGTGVGMPRV
jgi:hypothetical protein